MIRLFPSFAAVLSLASRHDVSSLLGASLARFYAQAGASLALALSPSSTAAAHARTAEAALLQLHAFSAADSHLAIPPHLSLTLSLAAVPACREECAPQLARLTLALVLTLVSCGPTSPSTASSSPHTRASLSLPLHSLSPPTPLPSRLRLARCHPHVSGPEPSQMQLQVPDTRREWVLRLSDDLVAEASRWHRAAWLCRPAGAMYIVRRQAHASRLRLSSSPQQGRDAGGMSSCAS